MGRREPRSGDHLSIYTAQEIGNLVQVNMLAPLLIAQRVIPYMMDRQWGRIVNIGSIWGLRGSINNALYNMTKHALSGMTKSIALECAEHGITCNEICPGPVESRMMARLFTRRATEHHSSVEEEEKAFVKTLRVGRMVTAVEVANVAYFLASDEASGVNGASVPVDVGLIA